MLLDEDPATVHCSPSPPPPNNKANTTQLIHECTSNFHTLSDRDALSRITSTLSTLSSSRSTRLNHTSTHLRQQTRRLQNLQQQHAINLQAHNPSAHAEEILRLDGEKFRIAKEASDAEIEGERLEGDVRRAEGVLRALEEGRESEGAGRADEGVERDV